MSTNDTGGHPTGPSSDKGEKHTAGAFDIRNVIGGLMALYGVILVITGLFTESTPEVASDADVNSNLYAGLAMLVLGVGFILWARLKPIVVPADVHRDDAAGPAD